MKITSHRQKSDSSILVLKSGFTLLEMVIVLGIIAMIMGGAIFTMQKISDSGKVTVVGGDFSSISNALQAYQTNAGHYPSEQQGLSALVVKPKEAPRPRRWIQIMDEVPKDPWGNDYVYRFPGSKDRSRPEIISAGKDGLIDTEDDFSNQDE